MPELEPDRTLSHPWRILSAMIAGGSVPHALLFTGIDGTGKLEAARRFAMALNCRRMAPPRDADPARQPAVPCGECQACRKIRSDNHPDVLWIKPAGSFIRIDVIRELCRVLAMKPYEASFRVVIICNAQAMNQPAANALLKVLEEPPHGTILVLTADSVSGLLPTVVSRCQQIRFAPLPAAELAERLAIAHGVDVQEATALSMMAGGSLARALSLHRGGWAERRRWLLAQLEDLPQMPPGLLMATAARLAKSREFLERYLEIIYSWTRDLAVCRIAPRHVVCQDVIDSLQRSARHLTAAEVLRQADMVLTAQRQVRANANPRLTAEVLMLRLADCGRKAYDSDGRPAGR